MALTCIDIPKFAEATLDDYFRTLKKHHPSIPKGLEMAEFLVENHDILWNHDMMIGLRNLNSKE